MRKNFETVLLIVLPILIVAAMYYNAEAMNRIFIIEKGLDLENKVCQARILPDQYNLTITKGDKVFLNMKILNQGNFIWSNSGDYVVKLSYHVLDQGRNVLEFENQRFGLPAEVRPNTEVEIDIELQPQLETGDYILEFDLVEEGRTWFKEKNSPTALVKLHINDNM